MNEKESFRKSSLGERATESDFGELRHLNAARLKAGAHYTGICRKRELFLSQNSRERRSVTGFADNRASVYFSKARRSGRWR
jgi:hypothetical protein